MGSMTVLRVVSHGSARTRADAPSAITAAQKNPTALGERPMTPLTLAKSPHAGGDLRRRERLRSEGKLMANGFVQFKRELVVRGAPIVAHAFLGECGNLASQQLRGGAASAFRHHTVGEAHDES